MAVKILSHDTIEYRGFVWKLFVKRNMPFWHSWLDASGRYFNAADFGINYNLSTLHVAVGGTSAWVFLREDEEAPGGILLDISRGENLRKLGQHYILYAEDLKEKLKACTQELNPTNLENFLKSYQRYTAGLPLTTRIGRVATEALKNLLEKKGFDDKEAANIIVTVSYPDEHTPLFLSRIGLYEIGAKAQSGEDIDKELFEWLKKFENIPFNFCGNPWTLEDAKQQLEEVMRKDCKNELTALRKNHADRVENAKRRLEQIDDTEVSELAFSLQAATWINEYRKNVFSRVSMDVESIFSRISGIIGFRSWRDCYFLMPSEMVDALNGKIISKNIPKDRQFTGTLLIDGKTERLSSEDALSIIGGINTEKADKISGEMCKGLGASLGKVRGVAKIIIDSKDFGKLNEGEIIITHMTSVDFVPIMEKAAAFVTNEGGISSHAAIVAREMNKPCIIGTGNATIVFKDGDLIEVDADNGVVKKIRKDF